MADRLQDRLLVLRGATGELLQEADTGHMTRSRGPIWDVCWRPTPLQLFFRHGRDGENKRIGCYDIHTPRRTPPISPLPSSKRRGSLHTSADSGKSVRPGRLPEPASHSQDQELTNGSAAGTTSNHENTTGTTVQDTSNGTTTKMQPQDHEPSVLRHL